MKSKLSEKVSALQAALETVRYQIRELKAYYSRPQVRAWYLYRDKLIFQLRQLEPLLQAQEENTKRQRLSRKKSPTP
jgi:hypothetical protein